MIDSAANDPALVAPTPEEVRQQVRRIVASPDFYSSERNRRLLQHIVECSLRGERTNGYEIGTRVFGRPASFNATSDPIVRIEASKVRRDLEVYYLKAGIDDRIHIDLPKGGYRAVFSYRKTIRFGVPEQLPGSVRRMLYAALLGLSGRADHARSAWRSLEEEYPGVLLDPRSHEALDFLCGQDKALRELLLEGLRRAAVGAEGSMKTDAEMAHSR